MAPPSLRMIGRSASRAARRVLGAGIVLGGAACTREEPREFRIGVVVLAEGPLKEILGGPGRRGAELAIDEINANGGILIDGTLHRAVLRVQECAARPDAAASAVGALINVDSVDAVVAPLISAFAAPAAGMAQAAGVLFIAPMASNPGVTAERPLAFRLAFSDAFQGGLLAEFAYDTLGMRRVAALSEEASPYGRDIVQLFRERFERRGGRMVAAETFAADAPIDFRPQLRRIVAQRPDGLLLPNYVGFDSVQVRQARELGFTGRFLGTDSWDPGPISAMPMARGTIIVANWDSRSPLVESVRFVQAYQARFGVPPRTPAAATYDAVRIVAEAAKRVQVIDGPSLARAVAELGEFTGASANFRFSGPGAPQRGAVVIEVLERRDSLRLVTRPDD